ncbi:MAG TPA: hypothetical protein VGN17_26435 [Bryobacteraceae bacterium]|jgi:hypothetical protein
MIAAGVAIPAWMMVWFHAREIFWLYLFPVTAGYIVVSMYMLHMRILQTTLARGGKPHGVFITGCLSTMANLFGWRMMLRTWQLIPLYALGVGLAYAVMSRVYAVRLRRIGWLRLPRIIWRGDVEGVAAIRQEVSQVPPQGL